MDNKTNEEKKINVVKYTYGYDNGFKIFKTFIKNRERKKETLTFKIHEINGKKVLTHTLGEENLEYLNRERGEFFEEFTFSDLKNFKEDLEFICVKLKIAPNYGEFLAEIVDESNVEYPFEIFNILFSSRLFQTIMEDGFGYLLKKNMLSTLKDIENTLCENIEEKELNKIWGIDKEVLKYLADKKVSLVRILDTKAFIKERSLYEFKKAIIELELNIEYINTIKEFLNDEYEIDGFVKYIESVHKEEKLPKDVVLEFIADIKKISEEIGEVFEPYMESLRDSHDIMVEKYILHQEEKNKEILRENGKNIKIKQAEYRYNCAFLRDLDEINDEEDKDWLSKYIERIEEENIFVVKLSRREDDKKFGILIIKGNRVIDIKRFYNKETNKELNKYIHDLGKRNGWSIKDI